VAIFPDWANAKPLYTPEPGDWMIKEEVFLDLVSEPYLQWLNENIFKSSIPWASRTNVIEREEILGGCGELVYHKVTFPQQPVELGFPLEYESWMVCAETDEMKITGNFLTREDAILWIEAVFLG
jgi:hypothetical protein